MKNQSWEKRKEKSKKIKETTQVSTLVISFYPQVKQSDDKSCLFPARVTCFALIWQILLPNSQWHSSDHRESTDKIKCLQDHLKEEMEEHIRGNMLWYDICLHGGTSVILCVILISTEGKGNAEKVHERVERIQQLRGALREETLKNGASTETSDLGRQVTHSILSLKLCTYKCDWTMFLKGIVYNPNT